MRQMRRAWGGQDEAAMGQAYGKHEAHEAGVRQAWGRHEAEMRRAWGGQEASMRQMRRAWGKHADEAGLGQA